MKNIVVDLGNFNVKYYGTRTGNFSSKFKPASGTLSDKYETIRIENKEYYMEVGKYNKEASKTKKNYLPNLLLALLKAEGLDTNKEFSYEGENAAEPLKVSLCMLLPVDQMDEKQKYIDDLQDNIFDFEYKSKRRIVEIHNVKVVPEGYASFLTLSKEDMKGLISVFDIGSRTCNYVKIFNGKMQDSATLNNIGSFRFYDYVKEVCKEDGKNYADDKIPMLIETGKITFEQVELGKAKYFTELINDIKGTDDLAENNRVLFTGGMANIIRTELESCCDDTDIIVIEDCVNSNVNGCAKMMGLIKVE